MCSLTDKDVEVTVSNAFGVNLKVLKYRLEPFSKIKSGVVCFHYSLIVDVEDTSIKNSVKTYTFFLKTSSDLSHVQNDLADEHLILEEVNFYNKVYPLFMQNCECEKFIPRHYLVKEDIIILEDLRAQDFFTIEKTLSEDRLKSALSALARFHAATLLTEACLGKTLREIYPNSFKEKIFTNNTKFSKTVPVCFDMMTHLAEDFGLDPSLLSKVKEHVSNGVKTLNNRCNVLCHGDLWRNNFMFDNSIPPKCLIIDFQVLRYASPCTDFSMLLYLNTDIEYRKKSEYNMLKYYYDALRDSVVKNNNKAKYPTYEEILEDYKNLRLVGMMFAAFYIPGINLKPEVLQKLLSDSEQFRQYLFYNRIDIIRSNMQADPVYKENIKKIISETLEEAQRIFNV